MAKSRKAIARKRKSYEQSYSGRGFVLGANPKAPSTPAKPRKKVRSS